MPALDNAGTGGRLVVHSPVTGIARSDYRAGLSPLRGEDMPELILLLFVAVIVAILVSRRPRRRWWPSLALAIFGSLGAAALNALLGLSPHNPIWALASSAVAAWLLALLAPRRAPTVADSMTPRSIAGEAPSEAEGTTVPEGVDETAFQQWLDGRGLLNTDLNPDRLQDLRRQFQGLS